MKTNGQHLKLPAFLRLGNHARCNVHRDLEHEHDRKHVPTLHINGPNDGIVCNYAKGVEQTVAHGGVIRMADGDMIMSWHEFDKPLMKQMLSEAHTWHRTLFEQKQEHFVHCAAGLHRSPAIVIALLSEHIGFFEAIAQVTRQMSRNYQVPHAPVLFGEDLRTVFEWLDA